MIFKFSGTQKTANTDSLFNGTMEEMIEACVPNMAAANPNMSEEEARKAILEWFPTLKRWRN